MMLFFLQGCFFTSSHIEEPMLKSALSSDTQVYLIEQVDSALDVAENNDSMDRLYVLRDFLTEIKIVDQDDVEILRRYVEQSIAIEKKNAAEAFSIDFSFPDVLNELVVSDLSEEEQSFKQEIQSLFEQQNYEELLLEIKNNPAYKSIVYPQFVASRDIYMEEQTNYIQQKYTKIVSGTIDDDAESAQKIYDLCVSLEQDYPEGNLTVILDVRYRLQKILDIKPSDR